ncbi:MAG: PQQ-like beta-propeller repeat protein [Lentisphaerae bacterium]|nr:PQQ-like beta-propeller repeat protein [Lentisphaerota bacterium]
MKCTMAGDWRLVGFGLAVIGCLFPWGAVSTAGEAQWPSWRGPDRNGISREAGWNALALTAGPKILWKASVGAGYSAVSIEGDQLFTMGNGDGKDTVYCLRPDTGEEVWTFRYDCSQGSYPGPRATPLIDGANVYTVSREGHVFCLDRKTGVKKWGINLVADHGAKTPKWGHSASPWLEGDLLVLNACQAGIAVDKRTGKKIWSSQPEPCGYATPVVIGSGKERMALIFGAKALYYVAVATGKESWSFPWITSYDVNAADPVVTDKGIFISSGYGNGCAFLDVSGAKPKAIWQKKKMANHFSSSVVLGDHLYGIDGNAGSGVLRCLDLATGEAAWSENLGFGSLMAADGKLIILNERGGLFIAAAEPKAYRELSRATLEAPPRFWTPPVLCRAKLYCRNDKGALFCVDVGIPLGALAGP